MNVQGKYFVFPLALVAILISVVNRTMVRKIYEKDGRALSTFSLSRVIRKEYRDRFGMDNLYLFSKIAPMIFLVLVIGGFMFIFSR